MGICVRVIKAKQQMLISYDCKKTRLNLVLNMFKPITFIWSTNHKSQLYVRKV